jgi:hypothetical protein
VAIPQLSHPTTAAEGCSKRRHYLGGTPKPVEITQEVGRPRVRHYAAYRAL